MSDPVSGKIAAILGRRVAPLRFLIFVGVFIAGMIVLVPALGQARGAMTAFDIAAALFLAMIAPLFQSKPGHMRQYARANDANRTLLLAVSVVVTLIVLVAVASELRAKASHMTVALVVSTLALAWLFSNTIYALHYAHLFYLGDDEGGDRGGIDFPGMGEIDDDDSSGSGGAEPNYWDFAYFSFTLGMTFQTSDVEISSPRIRRVVLGQSMAAFVFNIGVLALTINVLGSS